MKDRWKEYIEELYTKEEKPTELELEEGDEVDSNSIGPGIIRSEIEKALQDMKTEMINLGMINLDSERGVAQEKQ